MDNATFQDYLKKRYENQRDWYSDKATQNKKEYEKWTRIVIILSALTPIIAALDAKSIALAVHASNEELLAQIIKITLITISAIVAIGSTTLKTFRYHELWITYRETSERLRSEKYLFDAQLSVYSQPNINLQATFVAQIEAALMKEHSGWVSNSKNIPADSANTTEEVNANVEKAKGGKSTNVAPEETTTDESSKDEEEEEVPPSSVEKANDEKTTDVIPKEITTDEGLKDEEEEEVPPSTKAEDPPPANEPKSKDEPTEEEDKEKK